MPDQVDICIIGAGVVGLATAVELSKPGKQTFVLERNRTFGLETSSHNSEVIHVGIYSPTKSLKTRLCVEGSHLLYEICEKYHINYKRCGKIIIASDDRETLEIERLYQQGINNGIQDLTMLTGTEIRKLEPDVKAKAGFLSPSTGIIDSWGLMQSFYGQARENGASFVFNSEVIDINKIPGGFEITVKERDIVSRIHATTVINATGLHAHQVAAMAGINIDEAGYRLHYCKGEYFSVAPGFGKSITRLIYPVPEKAGTGIHISITLDGNLKLGPSARYVDTINYSVDETVKNEFYQAARRYLPAIKLEDLSPDFAGIRPKLQGPADGFRDFIIREESDRDLPGLINLIGIESPGLTAAPAIARYVAAIVESRI